MRVWSSAISSAPLACPALPCPALQIDTKRPGGLLDRRRRAAGRPRGELAPDLGKHGLGAHHDIERAQGGADGEGGVRQIGWGSLNPGPGWANEKNCSP